MAQPAALSPGQSAEYIGSTPSALAAVIRQYLGPDLSSRSPLVMFVPDDEETVMISDSDIAFSDLRGVLSWHSLADVVDSTLTMLGGLNKQVQMVARPQREQTVIVVSP